MDVGPGIRTSTMDTRRNAGGTRCLLAILQRQRLAGIDKGAKKAVLSRDEIAGDGLGLEPYCGSHSCPARAG